MENKKRLLIVGLSLLANSLFAQNANMRKLVDEDLRFAQKQYEYLATQIPADKMPQTFDSTKRQVVGYERTWWCTGFYPGTLWYLYEATRNPKIKQRAELSLDYIKSNQFYTGNHDLGFMMYCSFGNAYRITNDAAYKEVLLNSAKSLSTRFRPGIPAIQSWNKSNRYNCPVIIDNMMNLELLEWASQNGGGDIYNEIAEKHANTTKKNHFRPDFSSYHVVDYDTATGKVLQQVTNQGFSNASAWARGQGWGLYGYTMMYRFTRDTTYLNQARHIANFILTNKNLPADKVPYWDFNDTKIPNAPRDASAAALMASALLELGQYTEGAEKKTYVSTAEKMLESLSSNTYRSKIGQNGGFLLMHSTGALPQKSEIDVPLIYADYYFVEALLRYKKWYL